MMRMSRLVGVFLTISVGVVATVLAQAPAQGPRTTPPVNGAAARPDQPPPTAASPAPVYECEIRIWKDGAPVTATMKVRALPGETSQFTIPDGTFDLRFRTTSEAKEAAAHAERTGVVRQDFLASKNAADSANNLAAALTLEKRALEQNRPKILADTSVNDAARARAVFEAAAKIAPDKPADLEARLQALSQLLATQPPTEPAVLDALVQDYNQLLAQHQARQPANANPGTGNASNQPTASYPPAHDRAENNDHERRLREIELKLERILYALDRQQPTGTQPRGQ